MGTAACGLALSLVAMEASAEPYVVLEPGVWIIPPPSDFFLTSAGLGGNAIVGMDFDREPPLLLSPQLALGAWWFPDTATNEVAASTSAGAAEATSRSNLRATVGWSVGIAAPIETQAYVRVGLGYAADSTKRTPTGGIAVDAGATGDHRIDRDVTVGLQLGYQGMAAFSMPFGGSVDGFHGFTVSPRIGFWF